MPNQNKKIVICKYCGRPEFWGDMRWLSGRCTCRDCYKEEWEREEGEAYRWDDLDGPRPTMEEYREQADIRECQACQKEVPRDEMQFTKDCHGEYYTEADEQIEPDY